MKYKENNKMHTFDSKIESTHKTQLGFTVPEDYFNSAQQEILARVTSHAKQNKPRKLFQRLSIAASFIIILGSGIFMWKVQSDKTPVSDTHASEQVFSTNIDNNVLFNSLFIEDEEIAQYFEKSVTQSIVFEEPNSITTNVFFNSLFIEEADLDSYTLEILSL